MCPECGSTVLLYGACVKCIRQHVDEVAWECRRVNLKVTKNEETEVNAKVISFTAKCSDMFAGQLLDDAGEVIVEHDGYVPRWFPGEHYGDYVELDIDIETGQILNWKKPSAEVLQTWIDEHE